jgi:uncharacterized protein YraI
MKLAAMALVGLGTSLALAPTADAQATSAYVTTQLNLRTGPDTAYPPVVVLPPGAEVTVYGCLGGWSWCDVSWGPNRGWVAGSYLAAAEGSTRVPFMSYAPRRGIPIISFLLSNYWDRYYRGRSWYANRQQWEGWDPGQHRWRDGRAPQRNSGHAPQYNGPRGHNPPPQHQNRNVQRNHPKPPPHKANQHDHDRKKDDHKRDHDRHDH